MCLKAKASALCGFVEKPPQKQLFHVVDEKPLDTRQTHFAPCTHAHADLIDSRHYNHMKPCLNVQAMSWPAHHIAANIPGQGHGIGTLHALPGGVSLTAGHVVQGSVGNVIVRHRVDLEPMDDGRRAVVVLIQPQDYSISVPLYHVFGEEAGLPERVDDWLGFLIRPRMPDFAIFQSDNGPGNCPFFIPTAL
jgi:hypothetical protein